MGGPGAWPQRVPKTPGGSSGLTGCSVSNVAHRGSVFLKCFLSRSSQCELCQGICIPLAFENTHQFKERKKKKCRHELSSYSVQTQEDGIWAEGLSIKFWLLLFLLLFSFILLTNMDWMPPPTRQGSESRGCSSQSLGKCNTT